MKLLFSLLHGMIMQKLEQMNKYKLQAKYNG